MSSSASVSDRTVNKVALCSAIFAGVAYVGYSFVRQAFSKSLFRHGGGGGHREDNALEYNPGSRRVYLRRLSGSDASTSTEALLGTLEGEGKAARLVLRPLSVQERIRELNLRARHFAETILAVQVQQQQHPADHTRAIKHTRSLQTSPTRNSPRGSLLLSPIDITHLGSSRCSSTENLLANGGNHFTNSLPRSSLRKRWSRRSLKLRNGGGDSATEREDEQEDLEAEGERLLLERQEELRKRLQGFEDGTTRVLTPYEAKSLVALLHTKDCQMLEKALITVSNSAAFTSNQDYLRDAGCLFRLEHLVLHPEPRVQLAALSAVSNMALNTSNQREMEKMVPSLLPIICGDFELSSSSSEDERQHLIYQTLLTLTNVAALSDWHIQFCECLSRLLELSQSSNYKIRMQALRLLVNLSTNEEMVPHLLAAKAPEFVWNMLDDSQPDDQMLRVISLLSNLVCSVHKQKLDLPLNGGGSTNELESLYSHLYGPEDREDVLEHLATLMISHPWEDIRVKARMVHSVLREQNGVAAAAAPAVGQAEMEDLK